MDDDLFHALQLGDTRLAETLIDESCANVNLRFSNGDRPVHYAVRLNDTDFLGFLLDKGADPCALNHTGEMPIHLAAYENAEADAIAIISLIISKIPAHVNALSDLRDDDYHIVPRHRTIHSQRCLSPLQLALRRQSTSPNLVAFLLANGADTARLTSWEKGALSRITRPTTRTAPLGWQPRTR